MDKSIKALTITLVVLTFASAIAWAVLLLLS
jgi:hypothetical protein